MYVRTDAPRPHVQDLRATFHEDTLKLTCPEHVYNMVIVAFPSRTSTVKEVSPGAGRVEILAVWNSISEWNWNSMFNIFGVEMRTPPPAKGNRQDTNNA